MATRWRAGGGLAAVVLFIVFSWADGGLAQADQRIFAYPGATPSEVSDIITAARTADVVLLGEVHDNSDAHHAQADLLQAVRPSGLAVEMIRVGRGPEIAAHFAAGGTAAGLGELLDWENSGWPDWSFYQPVFAAAGPVPYAGAALPPGDVRRSVSEGALSVTLEPSMSAGLSVPYPPATQAKAEAEMVDAHCGHLPAEMAPGMVEAQRLRDASLAAAVLRLTSVATDGPVVVIAGNGHVRKDRGAPIFLPSDLVVVSVIITEGEGTRAPDMPVGAADFVWIVDRAERDDPCAVFTRTSE